MNKGRWETTSKIPLELYMTKLTEEVGEVAKEISDLLVSEIENGWGEARASRLIRTDKELSHVIFIAEQMRAKIQEVVLAK